MTAAPNGISWAECIPIGEVLRELGELESGDPLMVNEGLTLPGGVWAMAPITMAKG